MVPIELPGAEALRRILPGFARRATISRIAGLLTIPSIQANNLRIELLAHMAVALCEGTKKPDYSELSSWLNHHMGKTQAAPWEDPSEDVFITNIESARGNYALFEGTWEASDFYLQVLLNVVASRRAPEPMRSVAKSAIAILKLSNAVAQRLGLHRWDQTESQPKGRVLVDHSSQVLARAKAVTFSNADLVQLEIDRDDLDRFIFEEGDRGAVLKEEIGQTTLERRPLIAFSDAIVVALPTAISPAIRKLAMEVAQESEALPQLGRVLTGNYIQLVEECLHEFRQDGEDIERVAGHGDDLPELADWLIRYDVNQFLHVLLLQDDIQDANARGFASFGELPPTVIEALQKFVIATAEHCSKRPDFAAGSTLLLVGGIGRGVMVGFEAWPDRWGFASLSLSDLRLLAFDAGKPLRRLLQYLRYQDELERRGVEYVNVNGDFNFYCYLKETNFEFVPKQVPLDSNPVLYLATNYVLPVRRRLRELSDRHAVETPSGVFARVMRFSQHSFFESLHTRPIYVSTEHLKNGALWGVIESERGPVWLTLEMDGVKLERSLCYELWSSWLQLLDRVVVACVGRLQFDGPLEIRLDLREVEPPRKELDLCGQEPLVRFIKDGWRYASVILPRTFFALFQTASNLGERASAIAMIRALSGHEIEWNGELQTIVEEALGGEGARFLHMFESKYEVDHLLSKFDAQPVLVDEGDIRFEELGVASPLKEGRELIGKEECNELLHALVEKLWQRARERLRSINRNELLRAALESHEAIINEREQWSRTALAIKSLYSANNNVTSIALEREGKRNRAAVAARVLIEIGVCECPDGGGRSISKSDFGRLLALISLLIEVATDSDAIAYDMVEPRLRLNPNGTYDLDRAYQAHIVAPFMSAYFAEAFEGAAGSYSDLYDSEEKQDTDESDDKPFDDEFSDSFEQEFGLSPVELVNAVGELLDIAVEDGSPVVFVPMDRARSRIMNNRGLSSDKCDAVFGAIGLAARPAWDTPPQGFSNKDLNPWRFRRRLSATARPIAVLGNRAEPIIAYGVGALRLGLRYLIERSQHGQLPGSFFHSSAMKRYIGSAVDERGHQFAHEVAHKLEKVGWSTKCEVQMRTLGAPKQDADGDIDVLAWNSAGDVLLVECKRLQMARTVAEIGEVCRKFRGEAKDELGKHLRRVSWVRANPASLKNVVGFVPDLGKIDARLVTNTHVPMRYLSQLPFPAEKIGPLPA